MTYTEIQELRAKKAKLVADARAIHDENVKEERELQGEEKQRWDKMIGDALDLGNRIEREEKVLDLERSVEADGERRTEPDPVQPEENRKEDGAEDRGLADFRSMLKGEIGNNEYAGRALQADSDTAGGYTLAPQQWVNQLIKGVDDQVFVRQFANVIPVTTSDSLGAPALDADPEDATWTAEVGTVDEDTQMAFGKRELAPHQLAKLIKISMKLLMTSALGIESLVRERLQYKVGITEEKAYLTGTGAGQPLGVMVADASGISTGRDVSTGNSTTEFTFDGLKNAKYSIKGQYWPRLRWLFHRDGVKLAAKIKAGDGRYMWENSVRVGEPDRLFNFPVDMSEYQSNTFTTGLYVGILSDWKQYWIADLQGANVQRLDELYAANNQIGFIIRRWLDGMPVQEEGFARVKLG